MKDNVQICRQEEKREKMDQFEREFEQQSRVVFPSKCTKCNQSFRIRNTEIYNLQRNVNQLKMQIHDMEKAANKHKEELESMDELKIEMEALKEWKTRQK